MSTSITWSMTSSEFTAVRAEQERFLKQEFYMYKGEARRGNDVSEVLVQLCDEYQAYEAAARECPSMPYQQLRHHVAAEELGIARAMCSAAAAMWDGCSATGTYTSDGWDTAHAHVEARRRRLEDMKLGCALHEASTFAYVRLVNVRKAVWISHTTGLASVV